MQALRIQKSENAKALKLKLLCGFNILGEVGENVEGYYSREIIICC